MHRDGTRSVTRIEDIRPLSESCWRVRECALLRRGLAPCEAPRRAVRRARPSCARAARASAAARARIAHSRCALRGSLRAFQLGSTERRRPVAQHDAVSFSVTPAQRNVYLLLAARACELNASSSRGGCHKTLWNVNPPPKSNFDDGRSSNSWYGLRVTCAVRDLLTVSSDVRDRHGAPRALEAERRLVAQWAGPEKV